MTRDEVPPREAQILNDTEDAAAPEEVVLMPDGRTLEEFKGQPLTNSQSEALKVGSLEDFSNNTPQEEGCHESNGRFSSYL